MSDEPKAKADIAVRAADLRRLRERAREWSDGWLDDHRAWWDATYLLLDLLDALTGDLLAVEWEGHETGEGAVCPVCYSAKPRFGFNPDGKHESGCRIDTRLTELGYPDQASRDAERARREKR